MSKLTYKEILKKEYTKKEDGLDQEEINERVDAAKIQGEKAITLLKEELGEHKKQLRLQYKSPSLNFASIREYTKNIANVEADMKIQEDLNAELFPND